MKRSPAARATSRWWRARIRIAWCMVGTAVYQVGRHRFEPFEEPERVEARRAAHRGAGGERAGHRGDQAVDVEQRHDVEADIARRERKRAADVAGGGGEIGVGERHDLRPRGGAGGVQHERDVAGFGRAAAGGRGRAGARRSEAEAARPGRSSRDAARSPECRARPRPRGPGSRSRPARSRALGLRSER